MDIKALLNQIQQIEKQLEATINSPVGLDNFLLINLIQKLPLACAISTDNNMRFANHPFLKLINKTNLTEILHRPLTDFFSEPKIVHLLTGNNKPNKNNEFQELEFNQLFPQGELRTLKAYIHKTTVKTATLQFLIIKDITEEQEQLKQWNSCKKRLDDQESLAKIGNYRINLEDDHVFWSKGLYRIFEWPKDSAAPDIEAYKKHIHPDDVDKVYQLFGHCIENNEVFDLTYRIITTTHQTRHVHSRAQIISLNSQKHMFGYMQDITTEYLTKKRLQIFKNIVDNSPELMAFVNTNFEYELVNKTFCDWFGLKKEEIIGQKVQRVIGGPLYYQTIKNKLEACVQGEPSTFNAWYNFPAKGKNFIDVSLFPLPSRTFPVEGAVMLIKNETRNKTLYEEIHQKEHFYSTLLSNISDTIIVTAPNGDFEFICDNIINNFGITQQYALDKGNIKNLIPEVWAKVKHSNLLAAAISFEQKIEVPSGKTINALIEIKTFERNNKLVLWTIKNITELSITSNKLKKELALSAKKQTELKALLEANRAIHLGNTFADVAKEIFHACKKVIGAQSGYVALFNNTTKNNQVVYLDPGNENCTVDPNLPMPIRGLREIAYKYGKPVFDNDFAASEHQKYLPRGHSPLQSVLFTPVVFGNDTIGLIGLANKPGGFTENDCEKTNSFADVTAVALKFIQNKTQLVESEEKYRNLIEESPIGVGLSRNNQITYANKTLLGFYGCQHVDELQNQALLEHIYEPDRPKVIEKMEQLKNGEGSYPYTMEHRIVNKKGEIKTLRLYVSELHLMGKRYSQSIMQDITTEKEMQKKKEQLVADLIYIEQKNQVLIEIKEQMKKLNAKLNIEQQEEWVKINHLINTHVNFDHDRKKLKLHFQEMHQEFYKKLKARHPRLTPTDLKHCTLIKMNLNTKEIASLLNVKPSSIQTSRVRLKQKMALGSSENLIDYILAF